VLAVKGAVQGDPHRDQGDRKEENAAPANAPLGQPRDRALARARAEQEQQQKGQDRDREEELQEPQVAGPGVGQVGLVKTKAKGSSQAIGKIRPWTRTGF
jgi:hypothetical protein